MPLYSGSFIISVSLVVTLRRLYIFVMQQRHSEFDPVARTVQAGKMSVADKRQVEGRYQ
jgi:hypothetical protein